MIVFTLHSTGDTQSYFPFLKLFATLPLLPLHVAVDIEYIFML